jgi:hypothetical protein
MRQHMSAYACASEGGGEGEGRIVRMLLYRRQELPRHAVVRQHASAYVSIRQHTSAYVSIRQDAPLSPSGAPKACCFGSVMLQ